MLLRQKHTITFSLDKPIDQKDTRFETPPFPPQEDTMLLRTFVPPPHTAPQLTVKAPFKRRKVVTLSTIAMSP